jgi:hypothetical protein
MVDCRNPEMLSISVAITFINNLEITKLQALSTIFISINLEYQRAISSIHMHIISSWKIVQTVKIIT